MDRVMKNQTIGSNVRVSKLMWITSILATVLISSLPQAAMALPLFARQTGQNCMACHAGGQFPELTPYGRMFKLTGFTMGQRTVPVSVMGSISNSRVADTSKSDDPSADFQKNGQTVFATGSLFLGGKVTDNIGAFTQITYDPYATQGADGQFHGHSGADNIDLRYADRFIDEKRDLIVGLSVNNNPSVSDPWNTAAAWMQYVPAASVTSHQFSDANTPFPMFDVHSSPLAGINVYGYWNKTAYAELGFYRTANSAFSLLSAGTDDASLQKLSGANNPYLRLALTREFGPHNIMIGTTGMVAHAYDVGSDTSDPNNLGLFKNAGIDAQYQYLLDPHAVTVQVAFMRQAQTYSANAAAASPQLAFLADGVTPVDPVNLSDTINVFRAKVSYVYQAKYGGSLAFFNKTGTTNSLNQTYGFIPDPADPTGAAIINSPRNINGSLSGNPATRGLTFETFWMPTQYTRIGAQYTAYNRYNGASENYDGFGRNAKDNNTLFLYIWAAY
jgi:hypothetical protein